MATQAELYTLIPCTIAHMIMNYDLHSSHDYAEWTIWPFTMEDNEVLAHFVDHGAQVRKTGPTDVFYFHLTPVLASLLRAVPPRDINDQGQP